MQSPENISVNWLLNIRPISPKAVKEVILKQSHNARRLANTKTRNEVNLSNRKLYRQKGTGRARAGSAGSSIRVGGGQAHGPRFHIVNTKLNKKLAQGVRIDILRRHLLNNNLIINKIELSEIKTKLAQAILDSINIDNYKQRVVIVVHTENENIKKSFGNIRNVLIQNVDNIKTVQIFNAHKVVITPEAMNQLKEKFDALQKQNTQGEKNVDSTQ